jgi:mannose-6-phosphate isomerase-like protein (cupin superfamily)
LDAYRENRDGWIVGHFMDNGPRRTYDMEVKYWKYPVGKPTGHSAKTLDIVEVTFILEGRTSAEIDCAQLELNAGDYVVIQPGTWNNLVAEILKDAVGLTIKAPSIWQHKCIES